MKRFFPAGEGCVLFFVIILTCLFVNELIAKSIKQNFQYNTESHKNDSINHVIEGLVVVNQTFEPISNAKIYFEDLNITTYTNDRGNFKINLPVPKTKVIVSKEGYEPMDVNLDTDSSWRMTFRMLPDLSQVTFLKVGDSIPNYLWDLELPTVKDGTITLGAYKDKPLVLYFWATWCSPCIEALNSWQIVQDLFENDIKVISVFMDVPSKAYRFQKNSNLKLPVIIGENCDLINRHFLKKSYVGSKVLIRHGKLISIPEENALDLLKIKHFIDGREVQFEELKINTYMTKIEFKEGGK